MKTYLSVLNFKIIGEQSEVQLDEDTFDDITNELQTSIQSVLDKHKFKVLGKDMISHDLSEQCFAECASCSSWTINRSKESERDGVDEFIKDGGEYELQIYCCDCLPSEHEWNWQNI